MCDLCVEGGGPVSKPIITIHRKEDLVRRSPSSLSPLEEVWDGLDEIPGTGGSPGRPCAATSAARTGGNALGISLAPPIPRFPPAGSCCLCTVRLCENRLANIDGSWRKDKIKRKERRKGSRARGKNGAL